MKITIKVNNNYGEIIDNLTIDQLAVIQNECQFKMEGSEYKSMSYQKRNIKWDGYKRLFNIQTRRFPIGLLDRVVTLLNRYGIETNVVDKRKHLDMSYNYKFNESMLRDYQKDAVIKSLLNGNGILKVATGGGKTVIAGCTIGALGKKSIFIVHTRDLLYQAIESFRNILPYETIGQIGDGIIKYENVTVATMQSLAILGSIDFDKYKYDEDATYDEEKVISDKVKREEFNKYRMSVQCIMMDEVQIVSSQMATEVRFLFESADYAFGYSASPWRDDGSDLAIEASFGKRIIDIDASQLIRAGYLVKPLIEIHKTTYVCTDISGNYSDIYRRYITENVIRNMQVTHDALERYNSGMNTLVLVTHIKHGEMLRDMMISMGVDVSFISGKSGMKKRKMAIQGMRDGKIQLMIASTIADVGLDIPRLECIVEAGSGKSSVTALQRLGRIMRKFDGKNKCIFITYMDSAPFINGHIDRKIEIWRTEPEFDIVEIQ